MTRLDWRYQLAIGLVAISVVVYIINYLIFRDFSYMMRLMVGQLAFLPISVIFVTIVINQLLANRAKMAKLNKLNMIIGAFFSEVGLALLKSFASFDQHLEELGRELGQTQEWSDQYYDRLGKCLKAHHVAIEARQGDLAGLRQFLIDKRTFLLRLLENPNLLEHESFTNLLWAVFHLGEELAHRTDVAKLSRSDYEHIGGDIQRAYQLLLAEWLAYMDYLQRHYPYLFSLAARLNPLNPQASAEITDSR
jgi:hypothetical protein